MVFHWDFCKQVSSNFWTLLSILADLNNTLVWMVSICPLISRTLSYFTNLLGMEPSEPITIAIFITFEFHSFWSPPTSVILSSTDSSRNIHIYAGYIPTQWITDAGRLPYKYIPLTLFVSVRKGWVGFYCERELEIGHNCNILTPHSYGRHVVSFLFSWCSTGGLGAHSAGWSATSYQQFLRSPNSIGFPRAPSALCGFPYHISLQLAWNSNSTQLARRTQLS